MNTPSNYFRDLRSMISVLAFLCCFPTSAAQFSFPNFKGLYGGVAAGFGVNPNAADPSELLMATGVKYSLLTDGPVNTGRFTYNVELIHESSDVFESRTASAEVEGSYLMFSAKASFEITTASRKTTDSVMWKVTADKDYGVRERLTDVQLTDVANARWKTDGYDAFVKQFGTHFVSSWTRAAHLEVVFEAYNITQSDQQYVDAMIEASASYAAGDASAKAQMSSAFQSLSSTARTRVGFTADGIAVDKYFAGATDLTALDQIQRGVITLLSDIEKQNGNVARYYTTAYADVISGFPVVPPYPEFPELKKAQEAFEQAYVVKLKVAAFRNGPRGPYLDPKELDYLSAKTAECEARLAQVAEWLKAFKQDASLKTRAWHQIDLQLPELIWYAAQPVNAAGPRGTIPILPVFVGGGSEVGGVRFHDHGSVFAVSNDPVWESRNNQQILNTVEKVDQTRDSNGARARWYEGIQYWLPWSEFQKFKGSFWAELLNKDGQPITYAKDRNGRYVVPTLANGVSLDPWSGPSGDLYYKMLEAGDFGGFLQVIRPIDGAAFVRGQPITLEARGPVSEVEFWMDGVKLPGGPITGASRSGESYLYFERILANTSPGAHELTVKTTGTAQVGFTLAPITFQVVEPVIAPTIVTQPKPMPVILGGEVTLSVTASGTEPLVYEWQLNGAELFDNSRRSGTSANALRITGATSSDAGRYSVTLRNSAGAVTSAAVTLNFGSDHAPPPRLHPADNNPADGRITISELTAYAAAWKQTRNWPIEPNPIPISYLTRAGALWKGGEVYHYDATVTSAPLWWVNGAAP